MAKLGQIITTWRQKRQLSKNQMYVVMRNYNVTNQGLLEIFLGKEGWHKWKDDSISADIILNKIIKCKEYLKSTELQIHRLEFLHMNQSMSESNPSIFRTLTMRQIYCAKAVIYLVEQKKYVDAIREFMDCISNYNRTITELVSVNEYALYSCLLDLLIIQLEESNTKSL